MYIQYNQFYKTGIRSSKTSFIERTDCVQQEKMFYLVALALVCGVDQSI